MELNKEIPQLPVEIILKILDHRSEIIEKEYLYYWTGEYRINDVYFSKVLRNPKISVTFIKKYIDYINGKKLTSATPFRQYHHLGCQQQQILQEQHWNIISKFNGTEDVELLKIPNKIGFIYDSYVLRVKCLDHITSEILEYMKNDNNDREDSWMFFYKLNCYSNGMELYKELDFYKLYRFVMNNKKYFPNYKDKLEEIQRRYSKRWNPRGKTWCSDIDAKIESLIMSKKRK